MKKAFFTMFFLLIIAGNASASELIDVINTFQADKRALRNTYTLRESQEFYKRFTTFYENWREKIKASEEMGYGPHIYGLLGTRYFLRDALGIAAGINEFSRQSDMFYMANYAQTINVIGAIKTTKTDSWLESTGLVLKLYREKFGSQPIAVSGSPEPLDVAATLTQDGKYLTLSVINATHQNYDLNLKGIADKLVENGASYIISGTDDMAYNDEQHKNRISIKENANSLSIAAVSAGIY
jgi:alpha-N-arabinofuranosidase